MSKTSWYTKALCLVFVLALVAGFALLPSAPVNAEADTIAASRVISDTTPTPGDTFTVTVDVDITGTVYGPVLNEDVPAGWTVAEVDGAGGTYNDAGTKWLWGGAQTTDKTIVYEVTVPPDATPGLYQVTGTVLATVAGETIGPYAVSSNGDIVVEEKDTDTTPASSDAEVNNTENQKPDALVPPTSPTSPTSPTTPPTPPAPTGEPPISLPIVGAITGGEIAVALIVFFIWSRRRGAY